MITETNFYKYECSHCGYIWTSKERNTNPKCSKCQEETPKAYTEEALEKSEDLEKSVKELIELLKNQKKETITWYPYTITSTRSSVPNCCKHCSNHPINGGSGLCNCTLPLTENPTYYYFDKFGRRTDI